MVSRLDVEQSIIYLMQFLLVGHVLRGPRTDQQMEIVFKDRNVLLNSTSTLAKQRSFQTSLPKLFMYPCSLQNEKTRKQCHDILAKCYAVNLKNCRGGGTSSMCKLKFSYHGMIMWIKHQNTANLVAQFSWKKHLTENRKTGSLFNFFLEAAYLYFDVIALKLLQRSM